MYNIYIYIKPNFFSSDLNTWELNIKMNKFNFPGQPIFGTMDSILNNRH